MICIYSELAVTERWPKKLLNQKVREVKELNNSIIINRHCADNKHVVGMNEMRLPLDVRYAAQANIVA